VLAATWFVLAGMGIVFATLALLVLVTTVLNRWPGSDRRSGAGSGRRSGA
jgi:Na+-transporting methylmalonyl-CoA/oxaloacetate decarboxylase gamma subunit